MWLVAVRATGLSDNKGASWDMENEIIIKADGANRDLGYPTPDQSAARMQQHGRAHPCL